MNPVIATVLLDPPSTLMFGTAIAALSWKQIRANPQGALKKIVVISAAWSVWYGLCVSWYFFARADWMFVYLVDTQTVPLVPAFLVFMVALILYGVIGALGTGILMQQGHSKLGVLSVVAAFMSFGLLFAMGFKAYTHVGTYAEYVKGAAPALELDSSMKMAMNVSTIGIVVSVLLCVFIQFRKPRTA